MRAADARIRRRSRFPLSMFGLYLAALFFLMGIHTGLLLLMQRLQWGSIVQTHIMVLYWVANAAVLTIFTRWKIKKTYDEPMQRLAEATAKVAKGDFSIYLPTIHTADKLDYLDVMILDFNAMVEELGSVETLKTDFLSNVSHEMKTPIAQIQSYAQLLRRGNLTPQEQAEYSQAIMDASGRLSSLITNILRLNKLENQTIASGIAAYDVCRQLTDCILQFEHAWDEKNMDLDIQMEDSAYVLGDESLMELVWNNLLSNAVKFSDPGGRVTIRQVSDGNTVTVSVSDSGCGMSQETMAHIFDKFYQGDTSRATQGNGLGLALAKRVMDLMGGEIQVESALGAGSTFSVTLPAGVRQEEINGQ